MLSESARATTAREGRFRVQTPNSLPRAVKVIALDLESERVVQRLAQMKWARANFLIASTFTSSIVAREGFSVEGWLSDLAGRTCNLLQEVGEANLVVMIATLGTNAQAAAIIGEACRSRHVMTTVLVTSAAAPSGASNTLAQLRLHANMLVAASSESYIEDMLTALQA